MSAELEEYKSPELAEPLLSTEEKSKNVGPPRIIHINNPDENNKYRNNGIRTTKYNIITFIPKNLWEQFHRLANVYFLFIALLQLIPGISPTGQFTTLMPLVLVLVCSGIKDAFEDWKRWLSDVQTNSKKTCVLRDGVFTKVKWKDVRVGDMIKIENREPFPADIIMFASSEAQGICYVETSSLDGETNLKIKRARPETFDISNQEAAKNFTAVIECEQPNNDILNFKGMIQLDNDKMIPLDNEQCLLRGSSLRNTSWIIGVVVFTGHDTKLMKNQNKTPFKKSKLERLTNYCILFLFGLEIVLCLLCCVGTIVFVTTQVNKFWYVNRMFNSGSGNFLWTVWEGIKAFFTFLILFNNLIPISLYVSVEIAKVIQGYFMSQDLAMYHTATDTPANVKTSALNEELGQIDYIFSDKTGTLTCNMMEFLKFSVTGISYGTGTTEIARAAAKRNKVEIIDDRPADFDPNSEFQFYDERISNGKWEQQANVTDLRRFFTLLAVCHTVIPEMDTEKNDLIYQASSPDEAALVKAAKFLGAKFTERTTDNVTINICGKDENYQLLNIIEFTSTRKKMSVICRTPEGKIVLMCKGADSVVFPILKNPQKYEQETLEHLEKFANDGLRTLVCAQVELDPKEYEKWAVEFNEAKCSFHDREAKIAACGQKIEKNLELIGVTAIEDKLQDGVPDTISQLASAGIKIWVLTGDKLETAINIGFACDLLHNAMVLCIIEGDSRKAIFDSLKKNLDTATKEQEDSAQILGMVVEGEKLKTILADEELKLMFLRLGILCRAVICCRVSPKQKADVVTLVKQGLNTITLAIGDGANDVSMIQAAHVGVGISGLEGLQAANSADYSIAQFRFLKRLLLVHGRWSYRRVSKLVLYSFYKNCVLYLTQFWFVLFNAFSGTSIHDKWTVSLYNVIFTSLPIMAVGIIDRDITAQKAEDYPMLYVQGHKNVFFNLSVFIQWNINAIFHSLICFLIPVLCMYNEVFPNGQNYGMYTFGVIIYSAVLIVVTIKVTLETSSVTWINVVFVVVSLVSWFVVILLYGSVQFIIHHFLQSVGWYPRFPFTEFSDIYFEWRVFFTFNFWATVLLTCTVALIRDVAWKAFKRSNSRNLYYAIQSKKAMMTQEELYMTYPMEEWVPPEKKMKPKASSVSKLLTGITGINLKGYKGFAFSQSDHQVQLLNERIGNVPHYKVTND